MSASPTSAANRANEIATIRIELRHSDPLIWRQVEVQTSITLTELHHIIQIALGWTDDHLWEFRIGKQLYAPLMDDDWVARRVIPADKVRLRDVLRPRKTMIDYLYDFGDSWQHRLTVTRIRQGEPGAAYPCYVAGDWNGPPEDCGGLFGFYGMLDALGDPKHPDHAFAKEWLDGYDPKLIDEPRIKKAFSRLAASATKARAKKQKSAL